MREDNTDCGVARFDDTGVVTVVTLLGRLLFGVLVPLGESFSSSFCVGVRGVFLGGFPTAFFFFSASYNVAR